MAESEKSTQEHKGWPKGKRRYGVTRSQQHGLHRLRETYDKLGSRAIDPSSEVGKVLAEWKAGLVQDLGGEENLSTQQLALVDVCVRDRLLLESIDAWLFGQPKLINRARGEEGRGRLDPDGGERGWGPALTSEMGGPWGHDLLPFKKEERGQLLTFTTKADVRDTPAVH